jgi:formylglycine-generating enzyme required for sulfatase activity
MRKYSLFIPIIVLLVTFLTISCNNTRDYKNNSRATGWDLNGKKGNNYKTDYQKNEPAPGLVFVEGGTFTMGRVQDDVMHDWNNSPTQQHIQSFYMDETEVTNRMYLQYLDWLKETFPPEEQGYKNIYTGALPDTLVWRNPLGFNENMVKNYLRHPAYQNYPVVGVNWIQATEFSQWRTDMVNQKQLSDEGFTSRDAYFDNTPEKTFNTETYLNTPSQVYGGNDSITRGGKQTQQRLKNNQDSTNIYVKRKDGVLYPEYRLPTEAEWEYNGHYTRSNDKRTRGDQKANFKQSKGDYGGIGGWSTDGADITAPIKSFEPNDYGLYDMAGNVAEWVADVYRPIVDNEFNDFNYFRGNVYTKNVIGDDGKVKVLGPDEVQYDTLSDGTLIARNLPGEIKNEKIGEDETYLRTQFTKADNRNFRDGDKKSSRYYGTPKADEVEMYNSPQNEARIDSTGVVREYDESNDRTTLINNKLRVYKGGSWRDRAYWIDPAQRRSYPQHMATDYIGFRNAMSEVGGKSKKGRTRK